MPLDPKLKREMRRALFEANISQKELSKRTGLAESTISLVLGGQPCDVKLSTIETIARALDCELKISFEEVRISDQSK
jgi:DNA-binding Xre family transcriptional regulator